MYLLCFFLVIAFFSFFKKTSSLKRQLCKQQSLVSPTVKICRKKTFQKDITQLTDFPKTNDTLYIKCQSYFFFKCHKCFAVSVVYITNEEINSLNILCIDLCYLHINVILLEKIL